MRKAPEQDQGDERLEVGEPEVSAAGAPAVFHAMEQGIEQMGVVRTGRTLLRLNQKSGFDCPGCAWPDPKNRHVAEFCENGAKAVAEEATKRRITSDFWAEHPISDLATRSDHWLGQQGRLTEPVIKKPGSDHYEPIEWDEALDVMSSQLQALPDPDEAIFYTSGRTSNEAAFTYQLLARALGTNNLPDCSNMCHESSGEALHETIGIGKGTVSLADFDVADLIFVVGQNPGTNHPRMLSALQAAKKNDARIIAVNPLPEAGLMQFKNPQQVGGWLGSGTELADEFCQIRLNGDLAFFQGIGKLLLEADAVRGDVLDHGFLDRSTARFDEYAAHLANLDWDEVDRATGLPREQIEKVAEMVINSKRVIVCWAMGLTQHKNSVPTIMEITNFLLLRGNIGRPGAGACPVRGHSNVQGDRSMGIYEKPPEEFLDNLDARFMINAPREHGFDTVAAIRAMRDGAASVFMGMGGNFVRATPDTRVTEQALAGMELTVNVSTKLNGTHAHPGRTSIILPTLGRTERDRQAGGDQFVTVEDSMSVVHRSQGNLPPPNNDILSEMSIITHLGERATDAGIDWQAMRENYDVVRDHIAAVVPGCHDYNERVRRPDGFLMPNPPRDRRVFTTDTGKANFAVNSLEVLHVPPGRLILQTVRSHDQYNTTIYGLDDRYRGISQGRRVVFVNPDDLAELGFADGDLVDLISEWQDTERRAESFRIVSYPTARSCAAAYFPEANVLVPLDSTAERSNTPTSKSIIIRLEPAPDREAPRN
ncbi:MAG: FdhF/YdeP family oxidoreductase [Propionibacteriales bacterium]|nr:FdhF/YdeP family oxidoreductase [Propionibacteriales bacterium]